MSGGRAAGPPNEETSGAGATQRTRRGEHVPYPVDRRYTKDHEWIRIDGTIGEVGITDYAQDQLGDVVYVELPDVGRSVTAGQPFGSVESVKAVSELFAPMTGHVVEVNAGLKDHPEALNTDPHATWIIRIQLADPGETASLVDSTQYGALVG